MIKRLLYFLLVATAIIIGLYPLIMLLLEEDFEILRSKNKELLDSLIWNIGFYIHISFGGIALLIGWLGFISKLRLKKLNAHRLVGKVYVFTAIPSALAGIYLGLFSNGGMIASIGFISMGIIWFYTTLKAYVFIRSKNILDHERMMTYSYAVCFAGVTFRIWTPLLNYLFDDVYAVYGFVAWWSWVPNLVVAYWLLKKKEKLSADPKL